MGSGDGCAPLSPHSLLWLFLFRLSLDRPRLLRLCSSSSIWIHRGKKALKEPRDRTPPTLPLLLRPLKDGA